MGKIILKDIDKSFDVGQVLRGFSLTVNEGDRLALMAPSGAGKTTLINIIMGLVKPDSGLIEGCEEEEFSCVFQEDRLFEGLDALTNIKAAIKHRAGKRNRSLADEEIIRELEAVGIKEAVGKPIAEFSGGMKRRVAICRALMASSDTVIMDEPFKGLDEELKDKVIDYVRDRIGDRKFILVTHAAGEAERLCTRSIYINNQMESVTAINS